MDLIMDFVFGSNSFFFNSSFLLFYFFKVLFCSYQRLICHVLHSWIGCKECWNSLALGSFLIHFWKSFLCNSIPYPSKTQIWSHIYMQTFGTPVFLFTFERDICAIAPPFIHKSTHGCIGTLMWHWRVP